MKIKNLLITLGLALSVGVGLAAGLSQGGEAKAAEADSTITRLYVDMSSCSGTNDWLTDKTTTRTLLRVFDSPKASFYELSEVVQYKYYTVDANIANGCQLVRVSSSIAIADIVDKSSDQGGSIYNYTSNYSSGNRMCTISGWDGTWGGIGGDAEDETYTTATTTPSTTTKRVWVNPQSTFLDANARAGLRYWVNDGEKDVHEATIILKSYTQTLNLNGKTLYYADIPVNAGFQLVRLHNAFNFVWTYGTSDLALSYATTKIMYAYKEYGNYTYNVGNETMDHITQEYAEKLVDGFSTCVDSDVNGYRQITNINNLVNTLEDKATFLAKVFSGDFTYGKKLDNMYKMNNGTYFTSGLSAVTNIENSTNFSLTTVIVIVSLVSLAAVGGYFLIRRRKQQ